MNFKFGVILAKAGQIMDDELFSNESGRCFFLEFKFQFFFTLTCFREKTQIFPGSQNFDDFLLLLGDKIRLKDWSKFRGKISPTATLEILDFISVGSDRSSRSHNVRPSVCLAQTKLSRAVNLHLSRSCNNQRPLRALREQSESTQKGIREQSKSYNQSHKV